MKIVHTGQIDRILAQSASCLEAGYPVHFRGPAGVGKTTLAVLAAERRGRQVSLLHGNDDYTATDLLGAWTGYSRRATLDNYIHTVRKTEEQIAPEWLDSRLAEACQNGWTLVYDEFNRSRPETNNVLLSIFEEGLLHYPAGIHRDPVPVHPEFRAVLTSNPREYAGVHQAPDALLDRFVTIDLDYYDEETEIAITAAHAGLTPAAVGPLVQALRQLRLSEPGQNHLSLRACVMLASLAAKSGIPLSSSDARFRELLLTVLSGRRAEPANAAFQARLAKVCGQFLA